MLISEKHKFVFCHLPKTGGSTIRKLLNKHGYIPKNNHGTSTHSNLKFALDYLGSDKFINYFKFGSILNPWALEVSRYFYIRKSHKHQRHSWADELDFNSFVNKFAENCGPSMNFDHFRIDGEIKLDFVIKLENFQEDFNNVCDKIGIPQQQLPHKNKSKHKHYTEYYNDETRQIVAENYAKDIEYFGYEFGK